jgi:hypothetical protein
VSAFAQAASSAGVELDFSTTSDVKSVLLLPPLVQVVVKPSGLSFEGVAAKTVDKFDNAGLKKLFAPFQKELGARVISVEATLAMLSKEQIKASAAKQPATLARAAKAATAAWVVLFEARGGNLTAFIYDALGESQGKALVLPGGAALLPKDTAAAAEGIVKQLSDLSAPKTKEVAAAPVPVVLNSIPLSGPESEEVTGDVDAELRRERKNQVLGASVNRGRVRAVVATGVGASTRSLGVSGDLAGRLAELRNQAAAGLGVYVAVAPLKLVDAWADAPWAELLVYGQYRKGFVRAAGASPGLQGQACGVIDDDFQIGGSARYRLGQGYLPSVGVAAAWTQERAWFGCGLPVASTTARGFDLQLSVEQPVWRDYVSLKVSGGPRFLMKGDDAAPQGLSLAGEAWLEAKPVSVLFARAGARLSRNGLLTPEGVALVDVRAFYAVEVGVFF